MITIKGSRDGSFHLIDTPFESITHTDYDYLWVDYVNPTTEEIDSLRSFFFFHELSIEDCKDDLQRPKFDHYDHYDFFVLHHLTQENDVHELDVFLGKNFLVTYRSEHADQLLHELPYESSPFLLFLGIFDRLTDHYFPLLYTIEDELTELETDTWLGSPHEAVQELFTIRGRLLRLRRSILPTRDLIHRLIHHPHFPGSEKQKHYFHDVHDSLSKLSDSIESNRELSSDLREIFFSLSSERMNNVMKTLTLLSAFFLPLTFVAGVYGMNFDVMPELALPYGYALVWILMIGISVSMFLYFKKKKWF